MKRLFLCLSLLLLAGSLRVAQGQQSELPASNLAEVPLAWLRPAAFLQMPSEVDCNSPAHWSGDKLYLFNSLDFQTHGLPVRSNGRGFGRLRYSTAVSFDDQSVWNGRRWIEATYKSANGRLYGWYHNEPAINCKNLTAPRIGAAWSDDDGRTWHNLGIVLEAPPGTNNCSARNGYFAGGHGDFSVILDRSKKYFYFFFSNYAGAEWEQGVAVARLPFTDRDDPVGKLQKWAYGGWNEPGLGGRVTPVFRTWRSWANQDPDSFWGPSVHWNTHLKSYVILLNRTQGGRGDWRQEGVYVTFNPLLANPGRWNAPQKILHGGSWYPQVLGMDTAKRETDKLAGQVARFFLHGASAWEIAFIKPGEAIPPNAVFTETQQDEPLPLPTDLPLPLANGFVENRQSSLSGLRFRGRRLVNQ